MDSSTAEYSGNGSLSKNANREIRKLLARSYLQEMRVREALSVYLGVLRDAPDDTDVVIALGNLYRLSGSPSAAIWLYRLALQIQPTNVLARRMVMEVDDSSEGDWQENNPISEAAIDNLAERLAALADAETQERVRCAADMIGKTADERGDETGEEMQQLMPALIALNIREARANGRSDLAEALQSLQINLARQIEDRWADDLLRDETLPGVI